MNSKSILALAALLGVSFGFSQASLAQNATQVYTPPPSFYNATGSAPAPTTTYTQPAPAPTPAPAPAPTVTTVTPVHTNNSNDDRGFILGIGGGGFGYEFNDIETMLYGISTESGYRFNQKFSLLLYSDLLFGSKSVVNFWILNVGPRVKYNFLKDFYAYLGAGYTLFHGNLAGVGISGNASGFNVNTGAGYDIALNKARHWFISPKLGVDYNYLSSSGVTLHLIAPTARIDLSYHF